MDEVDRLRALLPGEIAEAMALRRDALREVRLRSGRPAQLLYGGGEWLSRENIPPEVLDGVLRSLLNHSLYARESELSQGFFTLDDGCRVGVCGRMAGERMAAVGSVCIRIGRCAQGCAGPLLRRLIGAEGKARSALILSPPGLGKTTMLRELARQLSNAGRNVCIADERRELAACVNGAPTLDVGPRTDVMDGCPKRVAIPMLLRAASPEVIVADEIGDAGDAAALSEAARCGVSVIASAHAGSLEDALRRPALREAVEAGAFELFALLGPAPGQIQEIREGWHAICDGDVHRRGLRALRRRPFRGPEAAGGPAAGVDPGHSGAAHPHAAHAGAGEPGA